MIAPANYSNQALDLAIARAKGLADRPYHQHFIYHPTTDWRDAGPLLEELLDAGWNLCGLILDRYSESGRFELSFDGDHDACLYIVTEESLTRAICLAWLKWKEGQR